MGWCWRNSAVAMLLLTYTCQNLRSYESWVNFACFTDSEEVYYPFAIQIVAGWGGDSGDSSFLRFQILGPCSGKAGCFPLAFLDVAFNLGEEARWLFTVSETGRVCIYKNGEVAGTVQGSPWPSFVPRRFLLLGRCAWNMLGVGSHYDGSISGVKV